MKLNSKSYFVILTVCIILLAASNTLLLSKARILKHNNDVLNNKYNQMENLAIRMQEQLTEYKANNNMSNYNPREGIMKVPYNRIQEEQIKVYPEHVLITIKGLKWSRFRNTDSMIPVFDETSNALEIVPNNERDINIGDIIAYRYEKKTIVHRVIKIGEDPDGWFAITKGDNNEFFDPMKVRFSDIERVVVGIIY